MYNINDFMSVLERIAPLSLSYKMIEKGSYDNSGLLVEMTKNVEKVLFSLDLSCESVQKAVELGCDTIVTHHPAIYNPIKSISLFSGQKEIAMALKNQINVISMHLNLDIADGGIDHFLCDGLGGEDIIILDKVDKKNGYGRKAKVEKQTIEQFVSSIKKTFASEKIIFYGNNSVENIASFCGSGADQSLELTKEMQVDTIITSDVAHHQLKEMIENGKNVVIIPHYVSEQYGFNKFFDLANKLIKDKAQTFYFVDNRFM